MSNSKPLSDSNLGQIFTTRQLWMIYLVYAGTGLCLLGVIIFMLTLEETREFIGGGSEYCWMYGNFDRYLYIGLAELVSNFAVLLLLYHLARKDRALAYWSILIAWLFLGRLLSFYDLSYC